VFTARHGLGLCIQQICFGFKGLSEPIHWMDNQIIAVEFVLGHGAERAETEIQGDKIISE